jgi:preprotein translocase subunit YajC
MNLILLQMAGGGMNSLFLIGAMLVFMVFFVILPQRKKQKEAKNLQESLKAGDKVVTVGGFHTTIVDTEADTVTVEMSRGNNVKIDRVSIAKVLPKA